uniref:Uncharacterized protein n=1 Tax=Timema douglasi TaxID=61478 RepID=A0A7R8VBN3_TIMDO|nr:unnamed protein product [Timema douglasi]
MEDLQWNPNHGGGLAFLTFTRCLVRVFACLLQGSDPRVATCRGKLQNKRSKLNQEINKELRLRAGAENLFK